LVDYQANLVAVDALRSDDVVATILGLAWQAAVLLENRLRRRRRVVDDADGDAPSGCGLRSRRPERDPNPGGCHNTDGEDATKTHD
jgi:hypothetical protein